MHSSSLSNGMLPTSRTERLMGSSFRIPAYMVDQKIEEEPPPGRPGGTQQKLSGGEKEGGRLRVGRPPGALSLSRLGMRETGVQNRHRLATFMRPSFSRAS